MCAVYYVMCCVLCGLLCRVLFIVYCASSETILSSECVVDFAEKLGANAEAFAMFMALYCNARGCLPQILKQALKVEFEKGKKGEKGSIMRGSTFAVHILKYFVATESLGQYRKGVLQGLVMMRKR